MKTWKPHQYQLTAVSFLLSEKSRGLFLDPGLGKTSISLASIKTIINAEESKGVLIVAPLRVAYSTWPAEIYQWKNFSKLTFSVLHGKGKKDLWENKNIYLINPEGIRWLHNELLEKLDSGAECPFDTLWVDESTKFKSSTSKTFKLLCDTLPLFKRKVIMTGTPSPKSYLDLWSQIYLLDEGEALGKSFYQFRNKYFYTEHWDKFNYKIRPGAAEEIQKRIAPLVLEMNHRDYLNLPECVFNTIHIELDNKTKSLYKTFEDKMFLDLEGSELSAANAAVATMKCHQLANGVAYEDIPEGLTPEELTRFKKTRKSIHVHDLKIKALADLVSELNGKPLLIAYHYKHDLKSLKKLFGKNVAHIGAGVTFEQMKKIEKKWNAGEMPILLGHPASMAHGLNLQKACNNVCWFSMTWNLEEYLQFNARVYRQGVGDHVTVHHLVCKKTVDEAMLLKLSERDDDQKSLRKALSDYRKLLFEK